MGRKFLYLGTIMALTAAIEPVCAEGMFGDIGDAIQQMGRPSDRSSHGSDVAAAVGCAATAGLMYEATKRAGIIGQMLGAGATTLVCFKLKELSEKDNEALTTYSSQMLEDPDATHDTWVAPETKTQVNIAIAPAPEKHAEATFSVDSGVAAPTAGTTVEAATYVVAAGRLNFRNAPTVQGSNIIGFFNQNENVEVIGRTPDGQWALVGDNGVVVGYAAFTQGGKDLLVTPAQAARARRAAAAARNVERAKPHIIAPTTSSQLADTSSGMLRDATTAKPKAVTVMASTQCKAISATTGQDADSRTGCAQTNGKWAPVA